MSGQQHYCIIDIETTGGDPRVDRITEIAILRHDGEQVIDEFSSLVQPERSIPEFITKITGISNEMVREAPKFYEVARRVVEMTQDAIFVAHNVRFDYSFVQKEFRLLGYTYSRKLLCTVKLSRKLLPGMRSYSLGKLCKELEIPNEARHRALGDAKATVELFSRLLSKGQSQEIGALVKEEMANVKIPPNLARKVVEMLPDGIGVYYFLNKKGEVLYVGKSNHIRKRILSHFQGAYKRIRSREMFEHIADISYTQTGNELIALLLENEEIKRIQPPFNRAQRRRHHRHGIYVYEDQQKYLRFQIGKYNPENNPVAGFGSPGAAESALKRFARSHSLCLKLSGLERGKGPCFYYHLHHCKGACLGEETTEDYNERAQQVISLLNYGRNDAESFLIIGTGRSEMERSIVFIEKGVYRGYGYWDGSLSENSPENMIGTIKPKEESPDVQRIIQQYIRKNRQEVHILENARLQGENL